MPQIPHTKSVGLTLTSVGVGATDIPVEITGARHYTKFTIDLPADANVTQHTLQVNTGSGWKSLYTSIAGAPAEVTLESESVNIVELQAPMKGGIRLLCRTDDGVADTEYAINVTMSGSLYSEGRK